MLLSWQVQYPDSLLGSEVAQKIIFQKGHKLDGIEMVAKSQAVLQRASVKIVTIVNGMSELCPVIE
jgi:hypothetical protein